MSTDNITYRYAMDEGKGIVDIFAITKKDRKDYICLGCQRIIRPILGEIRQKHFRHKKDHNHNCSFETYLHRMGVWLFQETYQECLATQNPFYLETQHKTICKSCKDAPCTVDETTKIRDLVHIYTHSEAEKHDQNDGEVFVPDILLSNELGNKLYIEIVVSHKASEEKINSGIPIIEIDINREEDLNIFFEKNLSYKNQSIRFINFVNTVDYIDDSENCVKLAKRLFDEKINKQLELLAKNQLSNAISSNEEVISFIKETYINAIKNKEPFNIGIKRPVECQACDGGPCKKSEIGEKFDLTKAFPSIIEEQTTHGRKLAIQSRTGRKIYIQTTLTNSPTSLNITSTNDEIIEIMHDGIDFLLYNLEQPGRWGFGHRFHNFAPKGVIENDTISCKLMIEVFIVKKSGRSLISKTSYFEYLIEKQNLYYSNIIKGSNWEPHKKLIREVEAAFMAGVRIKNCYLCRYHAGSNNLVKILQYGIFCKFLKKDCGPNRAAKCEYYRPDKKVLGTERYRQL